MESEQSGAGTVDNVTPENAPASDDAAANPGGKKTAKKFGKKDQQPKKLHDKFEVSHASENLSCGECRAYISRRSLMMRRHTKVLLSFRLLAFC